MSAEIRPASTVLVLRDGPSGLEALFVRRAASLVFYGGAWVFPGGRIDASDGDLEHGLLDAARTAAARELVEEAGLQVSSSSLLWFSRWVTPPGAVRRYDTFYFAARAPHGEVRIDRGEIDAHRWLTPDAAIELRARGELELPPPTFVTLCELRRFGSSDEACARLDRAPTIYEPRLCAIAGGVAHLYEGDAGFEATDPSRAGARHRLTTYGDDWRYEADP